MYDFDDAPPTQIILIKYIELSLKNPFFFFFPFLFFLVVVNREIHCTILAPLNVTEERRKFSTSSPTTS